MKKLILITLIVLIIPILVVCMFKKTDKLDFKYVSNVIIRVKDEQTGNIIKVPFEEYVKGVLAGEMPTSFNLEALKAQAVAARSYALYQMNNNKDSEYDVVNTINNQVYLTDEQLKEKWQEQYVEKINKLKTAVEETQGQYLTYNNQIAETLFFSTSSGKTENCEEVFSSNIPYLRSVESTWDKTSPSYETISTISLEDFYKKLQIDYSDDLNIEIISNTQAGSVKKLKINNIEFTGRDIRDKLDLKSSYFSITKNENNITINTKGFGHGVGMSQYGALGMAKEGYTYDQILKYYYQGTEIKKL